MAIVESGHTDAQRTTHATLTTAAAQATSVGVRNPAVMIFGHVAAADLLLPSLMGDPAGDSTL